MDSSQVIVPIITLFLGGGAAGAVLNLVKARNEAHKGPVESNLLMIQGADAALAIMQKTLLVEEKRVNQLQDTLDDTERRLSLRNRELISLEEKAVSLSEELEKVRKRCLALEAQLETLQQRTPE